MRTPCITFIYVKILLVFLSLFSDSVFAKSLFLIDSLNSIPSTLNNTSLIAKSTNYRLCTQYPQIASDILSVGNDLGVEVISGEPKLQGKDATYEAFYGKLGVIVIKYRLMAPETFCQLVTHEFIHVLQHLKGELREVVPLGWSINVGDVQRYGSLEEAEAYIHQNYAGRVLDLLLEALERKRVGI